MRHSKNLKMKNLQRRSSKLRTITQLKMMRTMIISKFKNCRMIFKKILLVEEVEEGRVEVEEGMMEVEKDRVEVEEKREEGMEMEVRNEGGEGMEVEVEMSTIR